MDLSILKKILKCQFINIISSDISSSNKFIFYDEDILSNINVIINIDTLKITDINKYNLQNISRYITIPPHSTIYYIIPTYGFKNIPIISHHIRNYVLDNVYLIFIPTICSASIVYLNTLLRRPSLTNNYSLNWLLYPIDNNIITMNIPNFLKSVVIDNDDLLLISLHNAIEQLETIYGKFKSIEGMGNISSQIANKLIPDDTKNTKLILIDRNIDMMSTFRTSYIFEHMINTISPIKNQSIQIKGDLIGMDANDINIKLSNDDVLYSNIRHKHITDVAKILNELTQTKCDYSKKIKSDSSLDIVHQTLNTFRQFNSDNKLLNVYIKLLSDVVQYLETNTQLEDKLFQQDFDIIDNDIRLLSIKEMLYNSNTHVPKQYTQLFKLLDHNNYQSLLKILNLNSKQNISTIIIKTIVEENILLLREIGLASEHTIFYKDNDKYKKSKYSKPSIMEQLIPPPQEISPKDIFNSFKKLLIKEIPPLCIFYIGGITYDEIAEINKLFPLATIITTSIINTNEFIETFNS